MSNSILAIGHEGKLLSNTDELAARVAEGSDVASDVESFTVDELRAVILRLLDRTDDAYFHATSLLRELTLHGDENGFAAEDSVASQFRRSYLAGEQDSIVKKLEASMLHKSLIVRPWAIYTLGKICSTGSLPRMWEVFQASMERYPDIVLDLAKEICWLEGLDDAPVRTGESWIVQLVGSESFLNRWAAVEAYASCGLEDEAIASRLRADEHPYVSHLATQMIPENSEEYTASRLSIGWITAAFRSVHKGGDYTVADFEQFVDSFMAKHSPKLRKRASRH